MFWLLGIGVASVSYGLKGERIPGKLITVIGNDVVGNHSDNGLRGAERALWIGSGICEIALAVMQLHARYKVS